MPRGTEGPDRRRRDRETVRSQGPGDARRFLRGGGAYVADLVEPGDAHLVIVRSTVASGRLEHVDAAAARIADGVVAVVTANDLVEVPRIPVRTPEPALDGLRQPILATDRVRYVGEPIAVVVAEDRHLAEDAADLVVPRIAADPAVVAPSRSAPPEVWPGAVDGSMAERRSRAGDAEAMYERAAVVVSGHYSVGRQTGLPMEPRGLIAEWRQDRGGEILHLWGVTKYVHFTRRALAEMLDHSEEHIVVHAVDVGGMFGVRGEVYPEDVLVPLMARRLGRPVAWIEDRREHLLAINHSRGQSHDFSLAMAEDGKLLAFRDRCVLDAGAYARPIGSRMLSVTLESLPGPYRWGAHEAVATAALTNKTPVGTMRGPCAYEATFVRERAIDEAANALGLDPVAVRLRNLLDAHDLPRRVDMGQELHGPYYDAGDHAAAFRVLLQHLPLETVRADLDARRDRGELAGLGFGLFVEHSGNGQWESVNASLDTDGTVTVGTGGADFGQGLGEMVISVAARELGVDPAMIRVVTGDSRGHHEGRGTFGSRSTIFVGGATRAAMADLRREAIRRAAALHGVPDAEVVGTEQGFLVGDEFVHWKEVAPIEARGREEVPEATWGFGAHAAVVRIDPSLASTHVERLVVVYDCGRAIDPDNVRRQLVGGAIHGLGGALYEELRHDEGGRPTTTTLGDYLIPTSTVVPHVETIVLEAGPASSNTLGVRGVGEAGVLGAGAAIANAVADALGGTAGIHHLPIRHGDIVKLLMEDAS